MKTCSAFLVLRTQYLTSKFSANKLIVCSDFFIAGSQKAARGPVPRRQVHKPNQELQPGRARGQYRFVLSHAFFDSEQK
jgi:hypothetical protein